MSHITTIENTINHRMREKQIFNVVLAKLLGFDKILNPESKKLGGYCVVTWNHVVFWFLVTYVSLISIISCFNGLYYWTNHRDEAILYFGITEFSVFLCYKMSIFILKWRQIRDCLSITRFDFTFYGRCQNARLLDLWRNRIILITSTYALTCIFCVTLYVLSPLIFIRGVSTMKSLDGSQSDYRINVINLYAKLSAETYNTHFNMIYLIEATFLCLFQYFLIMFDTLLITLCLAYLCQLQMINAAFVSSGPKRFIRNSIQSMVIKFLCSI